MSSFISELLKPGGGIALIPFIRMTIATLLIMVVLMFIAGVARIHMAVLAFLSVGLLISISWFEKAWNDVQSKRGGSTGADSSIGAGSRRKEQEKTD
ncbi:hypothetical protein HJC23_000312 [Cyclotella cryptica]|uniref:Uncharacterized protein n=1 Tax=Cyclotella cryptica TaxID=29204 RepID=A0ABD3P3R4_9STRA|eukprot:CCRYP_018000-RA/>CCRYP_018000-RA protein AED:0.15 eAED:0.15 QI:220/1/1/1/1/1/2/439/96